DHQYQVPRAVQGMNELLSRDGVFITIGNGGTPMNNANMAALIGHNVPNVFPLTAARSMYEPFNRIKFAQFASYYDQMRAGVKYFVEQKDKKSVCAMYQHTDFGRDVYSGAVDQVKAMNMTIVAETSHKPTDTDFSASLARLRNARCDLIAVGTIVRDTDMILSTAKKMGWDVTFLGQFASYDTGVAEAPGDIGEGFYSMSPSLIAYPDDPRASVQEFSRAYKSRFGINPNFMGEMGYAAAQVVILALDRAERELTLEKFLAAMEGIQGYRDIFGSPPITMSPTDHHWLDPGMASGGKEWPLGAGGRSPLGY
ncbi:MAG: ABC transporter substrate-binding protein, partial [Rhodospirillales bacterium]|nr:ABC transporter substrate-binding protein [Rhodospirillales bacterium]